MKIEQIDSCHVVMEVNGEAVLSIRLTTGGAVNRMGDGTGDPERSRWYLGRTEEPLFDEWKSVLSDELLDLTGRYELPDRKGEQIKLTITLEGNDESTGFEFLYGSDSDGPPEEILELVNAAVDVTEEWWLEQRKGK